MRILALVTDAFGSYGGIAQFNRDLFEALARLSHIESIDIVPRLAPEKEGTGSPKLHVLSPVKNKFAYAARSVWINSIRKPDLIYNGHLYHGPLASRLAKLSGAKLVSQLHGTEIWTNLRANLLRPLMASDAVLCVSADTKNRYLSQISSNADNAFVLPNTVGDDYVLGNRVAARKKFGVMDEFAILSVGRLDARSGGYKGHERVIRILAEIGDRQRALTYLIAGVGDDRPRLEKLVSELCLEKSVRFLGKVPRNDLPDLYRAADVFALPSSGEGFGIVFIEAMACGTPAIGLDIGGAPDALRDGELGRAVTPEKFASALIEAINSEPPNRPALAKKTRTLFGKQKFQSRVADILNTIGAHD